MEKETKETQLWIRLSKITDFQTQLIIYTNGACKIL